MSERTKRLSAHERIMQLRKEFDIPEEETDPEEDAKWERDREARRKRMDMAVTEENYVKMFGRDPWTDEVIPGMKPTVEIAETSRKEKEQAAKKQTKISHAEWRAKYIQTLPTIHLPAEEKESKKIRKLRKKRKAYEEKQVRQQQIDIAYWWLETKLSKSYANELYYKYRNDIDGLIDLPRRLRHDVFLLGQLPLLHQLFDQFLVHRIRRLSVHEGQILLCLGVILSLRHGQ